MDTRHLVDPELLGALDEFPTLELSRERLGEIRAERAAELARVQPTLPTFPNIDVHEERAPGLAGGPDVRVLVYLPTQQPRQLPALVWIHGGGYVLGSADADDVQVKTIVSEVGCAAVSVDYRLAPESPFPAGVEDCYAALAWTHTQASTLGLDTRRIAIGGASAGGGLAAALGLLARDRGELPVSFQLLLVPMLDDRTAVHPEPHPYTGEFVWTRHNNRFGWTALLGQAPGGQGVSAYASPARAESLAGLPPTYIATGALDLFVEEDIEYARRLMRIGVPTELHVYPGAFHGFSRAAAARVTRAYLRDYLQALGRSFESVPVLA
jgi:triacylglycerol lipase